MKDIIVFEKEPSDFKRQAYVTAAYIIVQDKLLLLKLSDKKNESGRFGVPAGKLEAYEEASFGMSRELFEETGLQIKPLHLESLGTLYMRKPDIDYVYHLFYARFQEEPKIQLSHEHSDYIWAKIDEIAKLPLMLGAEEALRYYYQLIEHHE